MTRTIKILTLLAVMIITAGQAWADVASIDGVKYIDENGEEQTANGVTVLDGTETYLDAGWYVCNSENLSYTATIRLEGEVHLILADGKTMNVGTSESRIDGHGIMYFKYNGGLSLTIYGQTGGTGALNVYVTGNYSAIGAQNVTINGGQVTAIGTYDGILALDNVTINGGQVTATGTYGIRASNGDIILGWKNATDFIKTNNYNVYNGKAVKTANGQRFVAYNLANNTDISASAIVSGSSEDANATFTIGNLANMTLKPLDGLFISAPGGICVTLPGSNLAATADFSIASTPYYIYKGEGGTVGLDKTDAGQMADGVSVAWSLTGATLDTYNYIGTNGALQNTNNHLASFTLGTQDVTVAVDFNPFTMPGGYCGKSTVNDGKNVTWSLTENGTDSNDKVTYKLSIAKNATEGQTDYDMADYTSADAPWKDLTYDIFLVADEAAYTAYAPCLNADDKSKMHATALTLFAANATNTWATFCDKASRTLPEGCTAYTMASVSSGTVTLSPVDDSTISAYTPVLIKRTEGDVTEAIKATFAAAGTGSNALASSEASGYTFWGNASDATITEGGFTGLTAYSLYNGKFYRYEGTSSIAAHRCILTLSPVYDAPKMLTISEGTTNIKTTDFTDYTDKSDAWYTLDGRKLDGMPTKKGIYINGGHKVVIK